MSLDRIYKVLTTGIPLPEDMPSQTVQIATNATETAFLVGEGGQAGWDAVPGAAIVGSWDRSQVYADGYVQEGQAVDELGVVTGSPTHQITADLFGWIRPLGNYADGSATGPLDSTRWQGAPEAKFAVDIDRYPPTDSPFTIQIDRQDIGATAPEYNAGTTYQTGDYAYSVPGTVWRSLQDNNVGNAQFGGSVWWEFVNPSGWGWVCIVLSDDPQRTITARAIALYSDPEATNYLGTSGAFIQDGSYGNHYYCVCPTALYTSTRQDIYWALLFGAAQEGHYTLAESDDQIAAEFWEDIQS